MPITEKQLQIELDYLSRRLDIKYYLRALTIYEQLKKKGLKPKLSVNTWELYDKAFKWPKVRRYDVVQDLMSEIEHY